MMRQMRIRKDLVSPELVEKTIVRLERRLKDELGAVNKSLPDCGPICNVVDYQIQSRAAAIVQGKIKELERERLELTRPINEAVRQIKKVYDMAVSHLTADKAMRLTELAKWDEDREKERQEAMRVAAEKAEAERDASALRAIERGDAQRAETILTTPVPVLELKPQHVPGTGNYYREDTEFEVFDSESIPRALMSPDPKKIREFLNFRGEEKYAVGFIPGVRVWKTRTLVQQALKKETDPLLSSPPS